MPCKKCGKIPEKKYFDRIYCRKCEAELKEAYWNLHKKEEKEIKNQIEEIRKELDAIPLNKRVQLGSKGLVLLSKIHKLKCKLED